VLSPQQAEGHVLENGPVAKAVGQMFHIQNTHIAAPSDFFIIKYYSTVWPAQQGQPKKSCCPCSNEKISPSLGIHTLYLVGVYDMIREPLKGCRTMGGELGFPAGKTPDFAHAPRLFSFVFGGLLSKKSIIPPFVHILKSFLTATEKKTMI
jgi:hypothetical protein